MAGYSGTPLWKKLGYREGMTACTGGAPEGYALRTKLRSSRGTIAPAGAIWVSWPKKSSGSATDITDDVLRQVALPLGRVDI